MESSTITRTVLNVNGAIKVILAAISAGQKAGVEVSVAVCGPSMELIAFARADNATPHSAETSKRKAQTSASTRRATGWMPQGLSVELPLASGNLLTNIKGGMPIFFDTCFVGAVGVAGGTVEQDASIATEVLQAIGATISS